MLLGKQHGKKALLDLRKAACSFLPVSSLSRRQACHSKLPGSMKEVVHAENWHIFKGQLF